MTEKQVIKTILTAVEENFPKDCTSCRHRFHTYKDYIQETTLLGTPISYDAENKNWLPGTPLGFHSYCKCNYCSNTLTTNIDSLKRDTTWHLLAWIKEETKNRGVSSREILNDIREKMRKHVLD